MTRRAERLVAAAAFVALGALLWVTYQTWVLEAPPGRFRWTHGEAVFELLQPRWLGVLLVAPVVVWALRYSLADLPWQQRLLSFLLRLAFLACLAIGLGHPSRISESRKICTVALIDVSDSVSDEAFGEAEQTIAELARARGQDDTLKIVTFGARPRLAAVIDRDHPWRPGPRTRWRQPSHRLDPNPGAGSDLEGALELAQGLFPPGHLRRVILLSDGAETRGSVVAEASRARRLGATVHSKAYQSPAPGEVAVTALRAPSKVSLGEPFELVASVFSSRTTTARARLYQGETLNGLDAVRSLDLRPGNNEVRFRSVVRIGGEVTYGLRLDQLGEDKFAENNRYSLTLDVPGRPAVLYVEGRTQHARYLAGALTAQQFDVDVRSPTAMPSSMQELERFDFVVLSDTPKESISLASQEVVTRYVRDLGGGFLFAGGESGYGLGGWSNSAIERLLPVRMDVQRRRDAPGVAMVLVIDRSGSMTGLPLEMAKAACTATVSTLEANDQIEVLAFDSSPHRYVRMQPARYRTRIENEIARIQPGGGTEIFSALDMAYQDLSAVQARKKHVILLTDGQAPREGIFELVQAMVAEAMTVTAVGLGKSADAELLRSIADAGGGRYHEVPDPNSLPRIFTRETELVARQAAVEEWFPVQQTAPADFLKGIALGSAPLLHGYVATEMKPTPAQMILSSDRGEPILARWHVGLGWALAWTSDVKNLWAVDWLQWPGYGRFWGQLIREHMRQKHHRELDMQTEVVDDEVRATVDAFTLNERFDNRLESKLVVSGPQPGGRRRELPMRQIAPGRYEARFRLNEYGAFVLKASHAQRADNGELRPAGVSYGHVSHPYPREYQTFQPDVDRLRQTAHAGGGRLAPAPAVLFDPGEESIKIHVPLWDRFVLASIGLFLIDLLLRRVRLFDRGFAAKRSQAA